MGAPAVLFCVWGRGGGLQQPCFYASCADLGIWYGRSNYAYLNIKVTEIGLGLWPFPPSDKLSLIYSRIPN